jgi:hypothetical protein
MNVKRIIALGAVLLASATYASADPVTGQISIFGSDTYTSTNVTFVPGSGSVALASTTPGSSMAVFTGGNPVTLNSFNFDGGFVPGTVVFTTTQAGETLSFILNSILQATTLPNALGSTDLVILGTGTVTETGVHNYDPTFGTFNFTSQNGVLGSLVPVSFSATTTAVTPEPSSLILLGTGLVSSAGMLFRRRQTA